MNRQHLDDTEFWKKISFGLELDSEQEDYFEKLRNAVSEIQTQAVQEFREAFEIVMNDLEESGEDPQRLQDMISDIFSVFTKNSPKITVAFCKLTHSLTDNQRRTIRSRLKRLVI